MNFKKILATIFLSSCLFLNATSTEIEPSKRKDALNQRLAKIETEIKKNFPFYHYSSCH